MRIIVGLIILLLCLSYHPSIHQYTSMSYSNPLSWIFKDYYSNPEQLDTSLLSRYKSQAFMLFIIAQFMIIAALICSFYLNCNCITLYGPIKIAICILFIGTTLLYWLFDRQAELDASKCSSALTTLTTEWIIGKGNFLGVEKYDFVFYAYEQCLTSTEFNVKNINKSMQGVMQYEPQMPGFANDISMLYSLTAVNPINTSSQIYLPFLQLFGPLSLNSTISYNYNNTIFPQVLKIASTTSNLIEASNFQSMLQICHSYDQTYLSMRELYKSYYNGLETQLFALYSDKQIATLYSKTPKIVISISLTAVIIFIILHFVSTVYAPVLILELLFGIVIQTLLVGVAGALLSSSISVSQTCFILSTAFSNNNLNQEYVLNWLGSSDYNYSYSSPFMNSCLFGTNAIQFVYDPSITLQLTNLISNYQLLFNNYVSWYNTNNMSQYVNYLFSYPYALYDDLSSLIYNPSPEALPYSTNMLIALNILTHTDSPCIINDAWVYNSTECPLDSVVILSSDLNYANYAIGPLSCLSLTDINTTMFKLRYNSSFIEKCDPSNSIYDIYSPLSQFTLSAVQSLGQAQDTLGSMLNPFAEIGSNIYDGYTKFSYVNRSLQQMVVILNQVAANPAIDICQEFKSDLKEFVGSKCVWAYSSSLCLLSTCLMIILVTIYLCVVIVASRKQSGSNMYNKVTQDIQIIK